MTQELRAAGALGGAFVALLAIGLPLMILLALDPASQAACGGTPTGPGPSSVPGIPSNLLPIFEGASQQFALGSDGWAYLAALNNAESTFATNNGPGTGVLSGANSAGAAGPMQIGIGGQATDNWDTVVGEIPPNLPGGVQPPSVYNEVDAVYAAAALLRKWGAPGDWQAALVAWNNYAPEIAQVTQLVAQYTHGVASSGTSATATGTTTSAPVSSGGCAPISGPTTPGAVAKILPNGTAAIPTGAPPQVQEAIAAGNRIIDTFYSQERRTNMLEQVQDSYDCSGSTDFVLFNSGLGNTPLVDVGGGVAGDSSLLESYGQQGAGQWITVYGSQGHAFIEVAGIVLDTAHYAPVQPASVPDSFPADDPANGGPTTGPRWQPASIIAAQLQDGNVWSTRHPSGL